MLSFKTAQELEIVELANATSGLDEKKLKELFPKLFSKDIGYLKDKAVKLHIDETVPACALPREGGCGKGTYET